MFCQIVEYQLRPDKTTAFQKALRTLILPLLERQPGFVSQSYLSGEVSPEKLVAVTVWQSKEHAERFHWNEHLAVLSVIGELVKPAPKYEGYQVLCSSSIEVGKSKQSKRNALDEAARARASRKHAGATDVLPLVGVDYRARSGGAPGHPQPAEGVDNERRSAERVSIQLPVSILSLDDRVEIRTCTKDLSPQGAFLYVNSIVEKGSSLDFVVALPKEGRFSDRRWLCCHGRVIRVEKRPIRALSGVAAAIEHFELLREM